MIYQKTGINQVQRTIYDVITNVSSYDGSQLVLNGLKIADVQSNIRWSSMDTSIYRDIGSMQGIATAGRFGNIQDIVCVSGMATCAAFIAARGGTTGQDFTDYIAIHIGGDERGISQFELIIKEWVRKTIHGGTIWVVGASPNSEEHLHASWLEYVIDFLGLGKKEQNNILFYYPANQIGLKQNGAVGEPIAAPKKAKKCGGCCYITTAACLSLGLGDDCEDLKILRWYRDNILINEQGGSNDIAEYYNTAPKIINKINQTENSKDIYQAIYFNNIKPAVEAIKNGEYKLARIIYSNAVLKLNSFFFE